MANYQRPSAMRDPLMNSPIIQRDAKIAKTSPFEEEALPPFPGQDQKKIDESKSSEGGGVGSQPMEEEDPTVKDLFKLMKPYSTIDNL